MARVRVLTQADRIGLVEPELSIGFSDYEVDDFHTVRCRYNIFGY
jgi:hypothetical protein